MANFLEENKVFEMQRRIVLEKLPGKRQAEGDKPSLCVISIFEHSTTGDLRLQVSLVTLGRTINMKVQAEYIDDLVRHCEEELRGRGGTTPKPDSSSKKSNLQRGLTMPPTPRTPRRGNKWESIASAVEVRKDESERDYCLQVPDWEPPDEKHEVAAQKVNLELLSRFRNATATTASSQPDFF